MTINSLGPISQLQNYNKTEKSAKSVYQAEKDSIVISNEAKKMAEMYKVAKEVENTPDVRQDKIDELKRKINDPSYINEAVIGITADRIIDMFEV